MIEKLKNKKMVIIVSILTIVILIGTGVYFYKQNHDAVVINMIENYENELSKNSIVENKEYSEEDLQKLKKELEKILIDMESNKSSMEILWGNYSQYDKLAESIKKEVKIVDEKIITVKKIAEQKAKEEAEKKAEEERLAKEEEERKNAVANNQQSQTSLGNNSNSQQSSTNSNQTSGNSNSGQTNSKPSFPWPGLSKYSYINGDGETFEGYRDPYNGNYYDLNGNFIGNIDW